MAAPDVTALQRSDLNQFLFADIGTEANGMTLSVLSVFARRGSDPWTEASRLAALPKAEATDMLAHDRDHAENAMGLARGRCHSRAPDWFVARATGGRDPQNRETVTDESDYAGMCLHRAGRRVRGHDAAPIDAA